VTANPGGVPAHQQVTVVEVRGTTLVVAPPKGG
jgi:membrane protein implicated in regulation of membrane protease activity